MVVHLMIQFLKYGITEVFKHTYPIILKGVKVSSGVKINDIS